MKSYIDNAWPEAYYKALLNGKEVRNGLSVLRPEYIILFKAKAYGLKNEDIMELLKKVFG